MSNWCLDFQLQCMYMNTIVGVVVMVMEVMILTAIIHSVFPEVLFSCETELKIRFFKR